jgi:hypothetical protein
MSLFDVARGLAFVSAIFRSAYCYTDDALADKITNLPGAENLDISFSQVSRRVLIKYFYIVSIYVITMPIFDTVVLRISFDCWCRQECIKEHTLLVR